MGQDACLYLILFFFNANNTNVQNNPSEQTIVMDSQIVDGFHSQVMRNQYG